MMQGGLWDEDEGVVVGVAAVEVARSGPLVSIFVTISYVNMLT